MTPRIRILLADAHGIVRRGLRGLLGEADDLSVVAEAENCEQVLERMKQDKPDVVVLDLPMPGSTGLEVIRRVRASDPAVGILILTVFEDSPYIRPALEAGANSYILKSSDAGEITQAVRDVYEASRVLLQKY